GWALWSVRRVLGGVAQIQGAEPAIRAPGHEGIAVVHLRRTRDAGPDQLVERHPGDPLGDATQNVGVVAIHPALTGLRDERQRAEPLDGAADGLVLVGRVPAPARCGPEPLRGVQRCYQSVRTVGDADRVR